MNIQKVIYELNNLKDDPTRYKVAKAILSRIEDETPIGKMTIHLLQYAEAGKFK